MTSLYQKITDDRMTARKVADTFKVTVLGTLLGEIQSKWSSTPIAKRGPEPDDLLVLKTVTNFVDKLKELMVNRANEKDQQELDILETYLPKLLTESEVEQHVLSCLNSYTEEQGNKIKYVMNYMQTNFAGRYKGDVVRKFIK